MATIVVRPSQIRSSPTPPPVHAPSLTLNTNSTDPIPVPNKHIPICSPGEAPTRAPATPPSSPPTNKASLQTQSLLHPPDRYPLVSESPQLRAITAKQLAEALEYLSEQPLPDPNQVFPWLHGLHPDNQIQLGFFVARRKSLRKTPGCLRSITIIKASRDLSVSRLKGAVSPDEIMPHPLDRATGLLEVDPRDGFSVRNYQIQVGKIAQVSDLIVYGDESTTREEVFAIAKDVADAQEESRKKNDPQGKKPRLFHTFMVTCPFSEFEKSHPDLVSVNSDGQLTGRIMDFFHWERLEMCIMSQATEIANNVWLGSTADTGFDPNALESACSPYDILIEATDSGQSQERTALERISQTLTETGEAQLMDFPSSGSIMPLAWPQRDAINIIETCQWIYDLANPKEDEEEDIDGDASMAEKTPPRKFLLYCMDGYTETSLLALAYTMYSKGLFVDEAWLYLHREQKRNFFAYASDLALLRSLQPRILQAAHSRVADRDISETDISSREPSWLNMMDGSLPSRILPYMYLGNLGHANNPGLLRAMGIKRVLSIGEAVTWDHQMTEEWGPENLLMIGRVQDNGVDSLTCEFQRCLDFIGQGREEGFATLVHCRVGVSRSATICIAEVMQALNLSFPRAYCYVRARRLNVIIQPHLRFSYELLKWEEELQSRQGKPMRKELDWATISREIALMNRPYSR